jgi:hypothetical protein
VPAFHVFWLYLNQKAENRRVYRFWQLLFSAFPNSAYLCSTGRFFYAALSVIRTCLPLFIFHCSATHLMKMASIAGHRKLSPQPEMPVSEGVV